LFQLRVTAVYDVVKKKINLSKTAQVRITKKKKKDYKICRGSSPKTKQYRNLFKKINKQT